MPLLDHFHGALASRPLASVHSQWAGAIAANLNNRLPARFVADAPMYLGANASADVAEYELTANELRSQRDEDHNGGIAVTTQLTTQQQTEIEWYTPPETELVMPADFPSEIKVEIRDTTDAYQVIAVLTKKKRVTASSSWRSASATCNKGLGWS